MELERQREVVWQKQRGDSGWQSQARLDTVDESEWRGQAGVTLGISRQASKEARQDEE